MKLISCKVETVKTPLARFLRDSACKQVLYGYFSSKHEAYIRIIKKGNEVVESSDLCRGFLCSLIINPCFFPRFHFS